ncbi:putative Transmembrane protein [Quillaja saponaria]|uniref:Transmembrane protein n=1 Tax=Quillaja saponaria TaxID=32244 RepID=A0AAD7PLX2_QUISA|nr:putative Transmembrane protein [Quillaja saponaria]
MGLKKSWSLKKVMSKELSWPWRFSVFKLKRLDFQFNIIDDVVFKILTVVEGIVLVSTLCFFFLCCGCHI